MQPDPDPTTEPEIENPQSADETQQVEHAFESVAPPAEESAPVTHSDEDGNYEPDFEEENQPADADYEILPFDEPTFW